MYLYLQILLVGILSLNGIHSRRIIPSIVLNESQPSEYFHDHLLRDMRRLSSFNANDRLVTSLPGLKKYTHRQWSGYVSVDKGRGHLFYWLFGKHYCIVNKENYLFIFECVRAF